MTKIKVPRVPKVKSLSGSWADTVDEDALDIWFDASMACSFSGMTNPESLGVSLAMALNRRAPNFGSFVSLVILQRDRAAIPKL